MRLASLASLMLALGILGYYVLSLYARIGEAIPS